MDEAGLPVGLASVKVRTVVSPSLMVVGRKALESVGTSTLTQLGVTLSITLVTVTLADVFVKAVGEARQLALNCPSALVTLTVTVQDVAPAPTWRLDTVIVPALATVAAAALAHVPPTAGGLATISPEGRVSTKPTLLTGGAPAGFVTVNVSVVVPAAPMMGGENDLVRIGTTMGVPAQVAGASATQARTSAIPSRGVHDPARERSTFFAFMPYLVSRY